MNRKWVLTTVLVLAFAVPFLMIGLPYWRIPYAQVALPDSIVSWPIWLVALGALAARLAGAGAVASFAVTALVLPAMVGLRVVRETGVDPTSHNLWPLELMIVGAMGVGLALLGAGVGAMVLRLRRRVAEA
jgi:hypothetical protein